MAAPNARMHLMMINLATGANISWKSALATWEHPFATNYILYLTILFNAFFLVRNIHLHPTFLRSYGSLVNSHVMLAMNESYSSCIEASHLLASSNLNVSHKFKRSSNNVTLACFSPCWGRTWFFHYSPGRRLSLLGYHLSFAFALS